jgi:hypothetical protein
MTAYAVIIGMLVTWVMIITYLDFNKGDKK